MALGSERTVRFRATLLPLYALLAASPVIGQHTSPDQQWVQVAPDTGRGFMHFVDMRSIRAVIVGIKARQFNTG